MSMRAQPGDREKWVKPLPADTQPEEGYEEWLAAEIEAGCAELDRGERISAEQVWKELGLE